MPEIDAATPQKAPFWPANSDMMLTGATDAWRIFATMNSVALNSLASLHSEMTRFVTRRLEHDIELQRALGQCRSPQDALKICTSYAERAAAEYWDELGKLGVAVSNPKRGDANRPS